MHAGGFLPLPGAGRPSASPQPGKHLHLSWTHLEYRIACEERSGLTQFPACVQPISQHSSRSTGLRAALCRTHPHGSWLEGALMQTPPWLFRGHNSPGCCSLNGSCWASMREKAALPMTDGVIHPHLSLKVLSSFPSKAEVYSESKI